MIPLGLSPCQGGWGMHPLFEYARPPMRGSLACPPVTRSENARVSRNCDADGSRRPHGPVDGTSEATVTSGIGVVRFLSVRSLSLFLPSAGLEVSMKAKALWTVVLTGWLIAVLPPRARAVD